MFREYRLRMTAAIVKFAWQRDAVILLHLPLKFLSFDRWLEIQDILVIGRLNVRWYFNQFYPRNIFLLQLLVVTLGDMPALVQEFLYAPHLLQTKNRVEFAGPPVVADFVMEI